MSKRDDVRRLRRRARKATATADPDATLCHDCDPEPAEVVVHRTDDPPLPEPVDLTCERCGKVFPSEIVIRWPENY